MTRSGSQLPGHRRHRRRARTRHGAASARAASLPAPRPRQSRVAGLPAPPPRRSRAAARGTCLGMAAGLGAAGAAPARPLRLRPLERGAAGLPLPVLRPAQRCPGGLHRLLPAAGDRQPLALLRAARADLARYGPGDASGDPRARQLQRRRDRPGRSRDRLAGRAARRPRSPSSPSPPAAGRCLATAPHGPDRRGPLAGGAAAPAAGPARLPPELLSVASRSSATSPMSAFRRPHRPMHSSPAAWRAAPPSWAGSRRRCARPWSSARGWPRSDCSAAWRWWRRSCSSVPGLRRRRPRGHAAAGPCSGGSEPAHGAPPDAVPILAPRHGRAVEDPRRGDPADEILMKRAPADRQARPEVLPGQCGLRRERLQPAPVNPGKALGEAHLRAGSPGRLQRHRPFRAPGQAAVPGHQRIVEAAGMAVGLEAAALRHGQAVPVHWLIGPAFTARRQRKRPFGSEGSAREVLARAGTGGPWIVGLLGTERYEPLGRRDRGRCSSPKGTGSQ